ncbi:MAG: glycosyltransferase family 4 protein [Planctomycetota bacterium]|jgi:glycosyltransferase involved in cell wall biosynthesis
MKILFDATAMALSGYHKGGAYRYGMEVMHNLPEVMPEDWELGLYFNFFRGHHLEKMRETCALSRISDARISRIPPQLLRLMHIPAEWSAGKHDLLHGPFDLVQGSRRSARIVTIHDLAFLRAPDGLPRKWIRERMATVPKAARRAHRIITVSEFSKTDIVERLQVDPDRVQPIYHGISQALHVPQDREADRSRLRKRYEIGEDFLLYLGTLQPNKNIEGLCAAFQLMRKRGYEGQLVLAGAKGWLYDEMWQRIVARGHDAGVLLTGFVDEEDIPRLYGCCSAFALVSFLEGFGIPVIEAMSCGAPVVAADACSLTEVTADAGLLVDPHDHEAIADALFRAATPGTEREDLVRRGLEHASKFTWRNSAKGHVEAYRKGLEVAGS